MCVCVCVCVCDKRASFYSKHCVPYMCTVSTLGLPASSRVFGGADNKNIHSDVWLLDTNTLAWSQPQLRLVQILLLIRCSSLRRGAFGCVGSGHQYASHISPLLALSYKSSNVHKS